ncbi:unnamed protein product [Mytilus coruscus]|uniref:Uncharacterized protein n=1 Tax=Mytilus coruscus TaxID=42192 RepID=A0A6J8AVM7_MYTCO|nr:unnamed protein product [Mytilus coruscus]
MYTVITKKDEDVGKGPYVLVVQLNPSFTISQSKKVVKEKLEKDTYGPFQAEKFISEATPPKVNADKEKYIRKHSIPKKSFNSPLDTQGQEESRIDNSNLSHREKEKAPDGLLYAVNVKESVRLARRPRWIAYPCRKEILPSELQPWSWILDRRDLVGNTALSRKKAVKYPASRWITSKFI